MRSLILCCALLGVVFNCWPQTPSPALLGAGHLTPFPIPVAPGQLLTLFVQPGGAISPSTSYSISAIYSANGSDQAMPVLQVAQTNTACKAPFSAPCPEILAVTVQVPFEIQVICAWCANPVVPGGNIVLSVDGVKAPIVGVQGLQDQVHFLTICDVIVAGSSSAQPVNGGSPCTPMVTHANGKTVSAILPAVAGEELTAYATGLGATTPALVTGQPDAQSSPTVTSFGLDFNYRVNALATRPNGVGAPASSPLFTGATKGFVGLYQVNFIIPEPPAGLPPCVDNAAIAVGGIAVLSNLTVSLGSNFSFDGAGICVTPTS